MRKSILGLSLLMLFFAVSTSQSYVLLGYMWRWHTFEYYINPKNADVSEDAAIFNIKKGASEWRSWCHATYMGRTDSHSVRNNGINTVFFRNVEYGAIASTYIFYQRNKILDFDMVFWDNPWQFFRGDSTCVDGFYVADIATHEFGHAIGLAHSSRRSATMYPTGGYCNNTLRILDQDDMNGAARLYGWP